MNTSFNFPTDNGPVITGRWYNPNTGDVFTARDSFFQDNQLIIQTTDGRMLDYNTIQSYIKVDDKFQAPKQEPKQQPLPQAVLEAIQPQDTPSISDGILADDLAIINGSPATNTTADMRPIFRQEVKSDDRKLVERLLGRAAHPDVSCYIKWDKFPQKQMDCLLDMMAVDPKEIVDYYLDNIDLHKIKETIEYELVSYLDGKLQPVEEMNIQPTILTKIINDEKKEIKHTGRPKKQTKKEEDKPVTKKTKK